MIRVGIMCSMIRQGDPPEIMTTRRANKVNCINKLTNCFESRLTFMILLKSYVRHYKNTQKSGEFPWV